MCVGTGLHRVVTHSMLWHLGPSILKWSMTLSHLLPLPLFLPTSPAHSEIHLKVLMAWLGQRCLAEISCPTQIFRSMHKWSSSSLYPAFYPGSFGWTSSCSASTTAVEKPLEGNVDLLAEELGCNSGEYSWNTLTNLSVSTASPQKKKRLMIFHFSCLYFELFRGPRQHLAPWAPVSEVASLY